VEEFVQDDLSNWYVRRRRRELWKGEMTAGKQLAYRTLFHVLVRTCELLAPVTPFVTDWLYRILMSAGGAPPRSVHLSDYPEVDARLEDPALEAGVALVRRAVRAGLGARNAAALKVRQPLARAVILAPPPALAWLRAFEADVLDELNVEALDVAAVEPGLAESLRAEGRAPWTGSDGEPVVLTVGRGPHWTAREDDLVVALDTRVTDALRRQGLARQLAHQVQLLRKRAGLAVDDRIQLAVATEGEALAALAEHGESVCAETLATELRLGAPPAGFEVERVRLDGNEALLGLRRVARRYPRAPAP
jgi:isoleucyl-tRNA synthetase